MNIGIVGSRAYQDYDLFKKIVDRTINKWINDLSDPSEVEITIVSGGASGVDSMAERYAKENEYSTLIFPVTRDDWKTYGKAAGPLRNTKIVEKCTHLIAFPSSSGSGTQDSIRKATKAKKIIKVYPVN